MNYQGTSGKDTYTGTGDADTIYGYGDNDTLSGGNGNDIIDGGAGEDSIAGGNGDDTLYSIDGTDKLVDGGIGDDLIYIGSRNGSILSTFRANVLLGGSGRDTLAMYGTATFMMNGFDAIAAGFENFSNAGYAIYGTIDANRFDFSGLTTDSSYGAILYGLAGNDILTGTDSNDVFYGGDDRDTLAGNGGADTLNGESGDDAIQGGAGADGLSGGEGDDSIDGGADGDSLNGGAGTDTLTGGDGNDVLDGADGNDSLSGGNGNDTLYVRDGTEALIDGGAGDDTIYLGSLTTATVTVNPGVLTGGTGTDTLYLNGTSIFTGRFAAAAAGFEILANPGYAINGTGAAESLDFSGLIANSSYGVILYGLGGNDALIGTGFNDLLFGGDADDVIEGGGGIDSIDGGTGTDIASYAVALSGVTVTLATAAQQDTSGAGFDTLANFEGLTGSRYVDSLTGDQNANTLSGGGGRDRLDGGDGTDILDGGTGNDSLIGGAARDVALLSANWVDYAIVAAGNSYTITDLRPDSPDGVDTLSSIEVLRFANGSFAIADTINVGPSGVDDGVALTEAGVDGPGQEIASGTVLSNDTDANLLIAGLGETLAITAVQSSSGPSVQIVGITVIEGDYGTLTIEADGSYRYDLANRSAAVQALGAGETAIDRFTYVLADAHGALSSADLAVTITGASDTLARRDRLQLTIGAPSSLDTAVLLGNDAFAEGTMITGISNATGATVQIVDGKLVINIGSATGSFDYTITALNGEVSTGHVDLYGVAVRGRAVLSADPVADAVDFVAGTRADVLTGGDGMDRLVGNGGADRLDGGAGIDRLEGGMGGDRYTVDSQLDVIVEAIGGGLDTVLSTANAYTLSGDVEDLLFIGSGSFNGVGNAQNNHIAGGVGSDTLFGNDGADTLVGGQGDDVLTGGAGADTASYADATSGVTVDLRTVGQQQTVGSGIDTLDGIENLTGGRGLDVLTGTDTGNLIHGGAARDVIVGNGGNDRLFGDTGSDILTGGGGADTFAFASIDDFGTLDRPDEITDFSAAQRDIIDLSAIDTDPAAEGDQAFAFIGGAAFTPGAMQAELRIQDNGDGSCTVQGDVNHDGIIDFALFVTSATILVGIDFQL